MSLTAITSTAVAICDGIKLLESIGKSYNDEEHRWQHIFSSVNRLAMLSLNIGSKVGKVKKIDPDKIIIFKTGEFLTRIADIPFRLAEFFQDYEHEDPSLFRFYEKTLIAPFSGIIANVCEMVITDEEKYLKEYKEKGEEAKRPIYEEDQDTELRKIVDYKSVDPKECKETIDSARKTQKIASTIKVTSDVGIKNIISTPKKLYEELHTYLRFRNSLKIRDGASESDSKTVDLVSSEMIPMPLQDDNIFKVWTCAITHMSVRDPVGDPTTKDRAGRPVVTLYERRFIYRWLSAHPTSPVSRLPLSKTALIEKPALKSLIENRLRFHGKRLSAYLAREEGEFNFELDTAIDPVLQTNADVENPS
ncbi:MAG: hypothetical protein K940chlam5_01405 [Candidatus Anoxychlamydiales bacterium]|nr:hypothetical protein [Candidatus Anoxychlamydiales bacterium]